MKLSKVKTLFREFGQFGMLNAQFGMLNAIRFIFAELTRDIFDPYNISSYSQTGEDRILGHIIDHYLGRLPINGEAGFYVDVGCNHPQHFSNTFALYKRGWIGITIDANKELIQKHQRLRKRDTSICAVVSDKEQEVIFTDFEDSCISSLNAEHISEWQTRSKIKEQRVVNTVSLSTILDGGKVPKDFDLLCIDVEGHDFEVLSSLNLNIYRPKLIVIEMFEFDFLNPSSSTIYEYLKVNNYKMIGYAVVNGYFSDAFRKA